MYQVVKTSTKTRPRRGASKATACDASSQRQPGFKGGVHIGTTASSSESLDTEQLLRSAIEQVSCAGSGTTWVTGLSGTHIKQALGIENADFQIAGAYPDGGIYFNESNGKLLVASEAKRQGALGNAIERWYKNFFIAKALGVRVYVTICVGDGFFDDNSAQRILQLAVAADTDNRYRCVEDIWNVPEGSIWLYRFRTAEDLAVFDIPALLRGAVVYALAADAASGQ
jgi:hypothetical protein